MSWISPPYVPGQQPDDHYSSQKINSDDGEEAPPYIPPEKGDRGFPGWTPQIGLIEIDGRIVQRLVNWFGGGGQTPALVGYLGPNGIVFDAAEATELTGGDDGVPVELRKSDTNILQWRYVNSVPWFDIIDLMTLRGDNGEEIELRTTATHIQWKYADPEDAWIDLVPLEDLKGTKGDTGSPAWSMLLAAVPDGERVVHQISDWFGGVGAKPPVGQYIGLAGPVIAIGDATDIRGAAGSGGGGGGSGDVVGPAVATNNHVVLFDGTSGKLIKGGGLLSAVATSGAYADLTGKPTITAQVQTDWNAVAGIAQIANKPAVIAAGATAADARTVIGAGTSSLVVGSGAGDAKAGNYVPTWTEVTGKPAVIAAGADQATARTAIGAGTSNLVLGTTAGTALAGNTAVLPDAPSDGDEYVRKNGAWAVATGGGGDSYRVGDVHIGTRHPIAGTWLELDNGIYLQSSYSDLYAQLGLIQNSPGTFNSFSAITMASAAPSTEAWRSIAEGANGVVVAISNGTTGNRFARSTDGGQAWVMGFSPIAVGFWVKIVYGNGTFVALNGQGTIVYSTDEGATWGSSALTIVDGGSAWVDIAFGGGYFVAIRSGTTVTNRSTDGISWSVAASTAAAFNSLSKIAFGNGTFVTFSGTNSYRSTDAAATWGSAVAMGVTATQICFGNDIFVVTNGGSAVTSPAGVSWSATKTVTPSTSSLNSFSYGNGLFYMTNATGWVGSWDNFDTTFTPPTPTGSGNIGCSAFVNSSIIVLRVGPTASRAFVGINYNSSTQFALPSAIAPDIKSWIKAIL